MKFMNFSKKHQIEKERAKAGFTMLELLIVIIVIGIATAIGVNRWLVSTERAKVVEVEKSVRSLKDYIDINGFDSVTKVRKISPLKQILNRDIYEVTDVKDVKVTNYFLGDMPDFGVIFICKTPSGKEGDCDSRQYDDKTFDYSGGPIIYYAIGRHDRCSLDETVYHSESVNSTNNLPTIMFSTPKHDYGKVSQATVVRGGKTYKVNYCLMPIKAKIELAS